MKREIIGLVLAAGALCAEAVTYSSATVVTEPVTGAAETVVVNCGSGKFVSLNAANTYGGATTITSGGVIVSNVAAFGQSPSITVSHGTTIRVCVDFATADTTLNAAILDRLTVVPTSPAADTMVSLQFAGDGLKNNVDLTNHPYVWLGAEVGASALTLTGTYTPCSDNVYRIGGNGGSNGESRGLIVKGMTDAPGGVPRRIHFKNGVNSLVNAAPQCTGDLIIDAGSHVAVGKDADFGTVTNIILRGGGRILFKNANLTYGANRSFTIDGSGSFHSCGATGSVKTRWNGPIKGSGTLSLTDQGGCVFASPSNTFTGELRNVCTHQQYDIPLEFGDGANFSWAGSKITQLNYTNNLIVINCDADVVFNTEISAEGGRLIKRGHGTATLGRAFPRKQLRTDIPVLVVEQGTLRRSAVETTGGPGLMDIKAGGTLDLGGIAADNLFLPYGGGAIVNPPATGMRGTGTAQPGRLFTGSAEGVLRIYNSSGSDAWQINGETSLSGGLAIDQGVVRANMGTCISNVLVGASGTLLFNSELPRSAGLAVEYWYGLDSKCFNGESGHEGRYTKTLDYVSRTVPDLVSDMWAWADTNVFCSGEGNDAGGTSGPLVTTMGATRNYFAARFTGYFIAEQEGRYEFQGYADDAITLWIDGQQILHGAAGSHSSMFSGAIDLTAGHHAIQVLFLDESGWEVFGLKMKAPGESAFTLLPTRLLTSWDGRRTALPSVTGTGTLRVSAGSQWPETLGLENFTGCIGVDAATASDGIGALAPHSAQLRYAGDWALSGANWAVAGDASLTNISGRVGAAIAPGVANAVGGLNTTTRIPLDRPFSFSFDFLLTEPKGGSMGDGFAVCLHDGGPNVTAAGTFSYSEEPNSQHLSCTSAYGAHLYMMPPSSDICWVKQGKYVTAPGNQRTNTVFTMNNVWSTPMHVDFTWDGTQNLVLAVSNAKGQSFCWTNSFAGAEIPTLFPNGAYIGLWGRNAGYFVRMVAANVALDFGQPDSSASLYAGPLTLKDGTVAAVGDVVHAGGLASALTVDGDATLTTADGFALDVASSDWTFNLSNATARLAFDGGCALSASPITVNLLGEAPVAPRVLADFTALGSPALTFVRGADVPSKVQLRYAEGKLSVWSSIGTVVFVR